MDKPKIDGHLHTELCPHGSMESTAELIEYAIDTGFEKLCFTEHAPLPREFADMYMGDREALETAALPWGRVDEYLDLGCKLKASYSRFIQLSWGFEVDYLQPCESSIRKFLDTYGPKVDEMILSVHFMPNVEGAYSCIDYSTKEFQEQFLTNGASQKAVYTSYYEQVKQSLLADLGLYRPQRMGHLDLIKKFQKYFHYDEQPQPVKLIESILHIIRDQGRELDYNLAGYMKEHCGAMYPHHSIREYSESIGIPHIWGSDAHSLQAFKETWEVFSINDIR